MNQKEYAVISGIIILVISLSSGATYYLEEVGSKTGCRAGWGYVSEGEFEGQYKCVTKSGSRFEWCFEVYNSSNTENYWCKKGNVVIVEKGEEQLRNANSNVIVCNKQGCVPL